jgi:hypothetical protein
MSANVIEEILREWAAASPAIRIKALQALREAATTRPKQQ